MRTVIEFPCADERLVGTLDAPPAGAATGLLIVSGGNEIRAGAHRGMAELAARLAERGFAVFRYDRRGIGDSMGENLGFAQSATDIAAAASAFRETQPGLTRLVALGNCDAATALALHHVAAGIDALVLSNPWPGDEPDALPPVSAIAARYAEKLRSPRAILRLVTGGVSLRKLLDGLGKLFRSRRTTTDGPPRYAASMAESLASSGVPVTILLADRDNTARAFRADWERVTAIDRWPMMTLDSASHSYASVGDKQWLLVNVLAALRG